MPTQTKITALDRQPIPRAKRALRRLQVRGSLDQWSEDEPMTIAEAVALDVTAGALSEKGIRTAIENQTLPARKLNGRFWITIRGIRSAFEPAATSVAQRTPETANDNVASAPKPPTLDQQVLQQINDARVERAKR